MAPTSAVQPLAERLAGALVQRRIDVRQHLGEARGGQPAQQRLAIGEVVVERADRYAGARGDLAHVRGVKAGVGEHLLCRGQDGLDRRLAEALAQAGCRGPFRG